MLSLTSMRAMADCELSRGGQILDKAAELEKTILNGQNGELVEVLNDNTGLDVQTRRPATAAEIAAESDSFKREMLQFDGVLENEVDTAVQDVIQDLTVQIDGYQVSCGTDFR